MQPDETSPKYASCEYDACITALACIEGERGPVKAAMTIMELGKPSRILLYSTRQQRRIALELSSNYLKNLDMTLEELLTDPTVVAALCHFADDFTRACASVFLNVLHHPMLTLCSPRLAQATVKLCALRAAGTQPTCANCP